MYDAVITGGGLAGLTLARQLALEAPELRVLVLERRRHPVPEAAFKVGESTVEIGAHYLRSVLGLEPHLRGEHLEKFGIRYFFPHQDNSDIRSRVEIGVTRYPIVPSFQIDRGRLENTLLRVVRESGVEAIDGCSVRTVSLNPAGHDVEFETAEGRRSVSCRWIADASGRTGLLRRKLRLTRPVGHAANACWFRVSERVRVDDWSSDAAWRSRAPTGERWLSTNHLMGRGYWVWLIPLGSGGTSIGIVADAALHPFSRLNRYDRALDWLREYEPQCAAIVDSLEGELEDFLVLRNYAYGCKRVFSPENWALVGEAGVFTDPFYSPGSDFIAIGNDCAVDLIQRGARGEDVTRRAEAYNTTYLRLYDAFLRLYEQQYRLMGNAQVMTAKASWDNACYWAIIGLLYFQRRYRTPEFIEAIEPMMRRFFVLHARMQQFFRAWDLLDDPQYSAAFANVVSVDALRDLQSALAGPVVDDETLRERLKANFELLERFADAWQTFAIESNPTLPRFVPSAAGDAFDIGPLKLRRGAVSYQRSAVSSQSV